MVTGEPVIGKVEKVTWHDGRVTRRYRPALRVFAAAVVSKRADLALRRLSRLPAIYQRVAIVSSTTLRPTTEATAVRRGIGVISVASDQPQVLVAPRPAVTGRPAIYRWWIDEFAYESHLRGDRQAPQR